MRRRLLTLTAAAVTGLALSGGSAAQPMPPCNDADGDGSPSGFEYAQNHVTELAHLGMLGNGGHKPGEHRGFSACDPSGG